MKCPSCATPLAEDARFCPTCTTPVVTPLVTAATDPSDAARPAATPATPGLGRGGAAARFIPGQVLASRYRVVRPLGRGGMGEVYQAEDLKLGQAVALKFLPRSRGQDRARLELLLNEVRLARQVSHPNVCQVYDVGEADGSTFLTMEYIEGEDLAALLKRIGRLSSERALTLAVELCSGLDAVHQRGILHRDLKPSNLMLDAAGRLRVTDFGLAWLAGEEREKPPAGRRAGTPAYMAPEQSESGDVTVRSDLYALGLVLYELFVGHRAARGENGRVEPPSRAVEGIDPVVERQILHCLEPDPERRPATAGEVAAALAERTAPPWRPEAGRAVPYRPSWTLERKLGAGGFGEVWLAVQEKTLTRRVFKLCHQAVHLQALEREVTVFRLLREELGERDDVVRIVDWNFERPPWFIESEFTSGGDLGEWAAARGGLEAVALEDRLELVAQVATALDAAHSIGVLHKDVKPSNVLVSEDAQGRPRARLADFGVGAVLERERLERAGITVLGFTEVTPGAPSSEAGTRLYMAPEVLEGKAATLQADVYALGVLLYQVVVGDLARSLAPGWQRDVGDELLAEDVAAAVDRDPERRLGSARQLAAGLRALPERRARRDAERRAEREAAATRAALLRSRRRWRLGLAVAALALTVAAITAYQERKSARWAARATNNARVAVAGEWLPRDPTRAALVLLEVDDDMSPFLAPRMRQALDEPLAALELRGHQDVVVDADWHPDGRRLATASFDGRACIWEADSGRVLLTLESEAGEPLYDLEWSPDGERLATAGDNGDAVVWDLAAPVPVGRNLAGQTGHVLRVAWDPDGRRLVTVATDATVRLWDAAAGTLLEPFEGHTGVVRSVAWSPDGGRFVTTSDDGTAIVWRPGGRRTGGQRSKGGGPQVLDIGRAWVWEAAWSPDGRRVVTVSTDRLARVWTVAGEDGSGEGRTVILPGHRGGVRVAAWSPDGTWLATASSDGNACLWPGDPDEDDEPWVLSGHTGQVWAIDWSPDGRFLLSTSDDGTARLWPIAEPGEPWVLRGHDGHVQTGSFSPDGRRLVTASTDETARIWVLGNGGAVSRLPDHGDAAVRALTWSGDGLEVASAAADGSVRRAHLRRLGTSGPRVVGGGEVLLQAADRRFTAAAWSPDGRVLLAGTDDGAVLFFDPAKGAGPRVTGRHEDRVNHAAWSADGSRAVTAARNGSVRAWSSSGEPLLVIDAAEQSLTLALPSPDGSHVLTAAGPDVDLWSADGARRALESYVEDVHAAAWSPDGRRVATGTEDGEVRIRSLAAAAGESPLVLAAHNPIEVLAWSPDGEVLVAGLRTSQVLAWDLRGSAANDPPTPVHLRGHKLLVRRAAFRPDGAFFATAAREGEVLIWETAAVLRAAEAPNGGPRPWTTLEGHGASVEALAWSADGRALATADRRGRVRVWHLELEDLRLLLHTATRVCLNPEFRESVLAEDAATAHERFESCRQES